MNKTDNKGWKTGLWKQEYPSLYGTLTVFMNYHKGRLNGKYTDLDERNRTCFEMIYVNHLVEGERIDYDYYT